MAKEKKGFLLYADLIHTVEQLPNDKAGELFKHILEYVNDRNPISKDLIINISFEPIKQQLKRDLNKWDESLNKKSESGKLGNLKRWHNDLYLQVVEDKITIDKALSIAEHRKSSHTDEVPSHNVANIAVTDTVTDTVSVTVKEKVIKEKNIFIDFDINDSLKDKILEYIDYRKDIKKPLKSEKSIIALIKKLSTDKDAIAKIEQTIENGWQGLFDLKEKEKPKNCNSKYNISEDAHLDPNRLEL